MTLLDHGDDLTTARQRLNALAAECDLIIIEELPLLESHQYLRIHRLKVTILGGVLETELFGLVEDVLHKVVLLAVAPAVVISLLNRFVLFFLIYESVLVVTVLVLLLVDLLCDRFLSRPDSV